MVEGVGRGNYFGGQSQLTSESSAERNKKGISIMYIFKCRVSFW